ncbi:Crystal protein ET79 [Streptomyces sp. BE20]|uniref:Crystal protein ET79 n=1 Tax=Streptomyces sp. BE20 TaxID=3002525 RepID=UPI002E76F27F|nr:Crystal protein ET79 [Streptomyces sp. BE20]MEE1826312.1 Crystal protein ET79 [Streptomyces sp. BE20]
MTSMTGMRRTAAGALTAALLAAGAVALAPAAQAAAGTGVPQASAQQSTGTGDTAQSVAGVTAARSTKVSLVNYTGTGLTKTWEHLDHGCWSADGLPPSYISNTKASSWKSESCGFATGTEGSISYALAGGGGQVDLHWNNPYLGSNSYSCSVPDGYTCVRSGGSGNDASVAFTISAVSSLTGSQAPAAESRLAAARSTTVNLTNNSGTLLTRDGSSLSGGIWSDGTLPPSLVQPGVTARWASESDGFMTGTGGEVSFHLGGTSEKLKVSWNNPYVGSNGYSCSAPYGYKCTWQGGGGNNASVSFTLSRS